MTLTHTATALAERLPFDPQLADAIDTLSRMESAWNDAIAAALSHDDEAYHAAMMRFREFDDLRKDKQQ